MAIEIERKFLVKNDAWRSQVLSESKLIQGYLARGQGTGATIRVRIGEGRAILNIKGVSKGLTRSEFEYEIPLQEGEEIVREVAIQPSIEKTRYHVRSGGHTWDLDVFEGENAGLVIAEIELQSEEEAFEMPEWAGEEVTDDRRYSNANLVEHPFSKW